VENQVGDPITVQYAADLDQVKFSSGFPTGENSVFANHPWNLTRTWDSKGSLLQFAKDKKMSGVTMPWTYSGMLFSSFCWHFEDLLMYSMNYLHSGSSKIWYVIPGSEREIFEKAVQEKLAGIYKRDKNFMLDINTLISPAYILAHNVSSNSLIFSD
jgi:histone demethylase JARID1